MRAEPAYVPPMTQLMTAAELLQPHIPERAELVRGVLVVREPPGFSHGAIVARLASLLDAHVRTHRLGLVVAGDAGFKLETDPDTVRGADVAFVRQDRLPDPVPVAFANFAPDLAAEVLSPSDRPGETLAKVADWLRGGTRLVWVIDPMGRSARIYHEDGTELVIGEHEALDGGDVIPGFSYPLASIF